MAWNTLEIILLSALIFCFIALMLFYWVVLAKPYYYMQSAAEEDLQNFGEQPPVSVIISIKKSNRDLLRFLPDILEQEYPAFEVIVVTDAISDENEEALKRLKFNYPNLYSTHVPDDTKNVSRKKLALTLGIKAAKYDKLLFTESNSRIRTKNWISLMTRHFSDKKSIVLGVSAFENATALSHKYMAYDYFVSNLQMAALALFNHPYAGNGRNMAYTKTHFLQQKGFVKYRVLQHGEDDLFVNEIATSENTAVELSAASVTLTEIDNFYDWKHEKIDRMVTKRFYKRGPVALWRLESLLRVGFIAAIIACFIYKLPYTEMESLILPGIALVCFVVLLFSQFIVINKTAEKLQLEKFYMAILTFDLFQPFIDLYFLIYSVFKGKDNYTYRYEKR